MDFPLNIIVWLKGTNSMIILFDFTNDGILYVSEHAIVVNKLKDGLLDCELAFPSHNAESFNLLQSETVGVKNYYWSSKKNAVLPLNDGAVNTIFLEKKQLAYLRAPAIKMLLRYCNAACKRLITFPIHYIWGEIEHVLEESNPDHGEYSYSITEYSEICGITPIEAYKELQLRVDGHRSTLLRIYSYLEYFSNKINRATTSDEIESIKEEIDKKFFKDNYI